MNVLANPVVTNGQQILQNCSLPTATGSLALYITHPTHYPNGISIASHHVFTQKRQKWPIVTASYPPKIAPLSAPAPTLHILAPLDPLPQTTYRSSQPFSTPHWTDRSTQKCGKRPVRIDHLHYTETSRPINNIGLRL